MGNYIQYQHTRSLWNSSWMLLHLRVLNDLFILYKIKVELFDKLWELLSHGPYLLSNFLKPKPHTQHSSDHGELSSSVKLCSISCPTFDLLPYLWLMFLYVLSKVQDSCGRAGRDISVNSKQKQVPTLGLTTDVFR